MACTTPILIPQTELANHILKRTDNLDPEDAFEALNSAIGTISSRVSACFCYDYPHPLECGVCEYPLPCCGIRDVVPWIKPRQCGCRYDDGCCRNDDCWHRLSIYDISCDNLITDGSISGDLRLEIYAPNPAFPTVCPVLAKDFVLGDTEIWIEGRVQLPPIGWFRIGDCDQDYVSFRCWEQAEYQQPEPFDVSSQDAWIDYDIDPSEGTEQPGIDPEVGIDVGQDVSCGVNTVAYTIGKYCFSSFSRTYSKGEPVELAFAAPSQQVIEAVKRQALVYSHELLLSRCSSPQDRQFYADRMQLYAELAQNDMRGYKGDRKPQQRYSVKNSFWTGSRDKCRTRRRRVIAGKRFHTFA